MRKPSFTHTKTLILSCYLIWLSGLSKSYGQNSGIVSKGSLGIGFHLACPQNELMDIKYDEGFGLNLSYLSRRYPYKSKINYQLGIQLDFGNMGSKEFADIALDDPNIIGDATIEVSNRMYGAFLVGRVNFGNENNRVIPYFNVLIGHRNYNTSQLLSLNEPSLNQEYQSDTLTRKVVFTKRLHYGIGAGLSYQLTNSLSMEAGAIYTVGGIGAVLPLTDVSRLNDGNEIDYTEYQSVRTDLLLVNLTIRLHLFKRYTYQPYVPTTLSPISMPRYTRYTDNGNTGNNRNLNNPNTTNTPTPRKKTPIKIKPNGPTRDKNDKS